MKDIIYSKATAENSDGVIGFLLKTMEESHALFLSEDEMSRDIHKNESKIKERLKSSAVDTDKFMGVAHANDKIVGAITARILDDSIFIDFIYVDQDFRGKGIGPALTKRCIAYFYGVKKVRSIGLQVYEKNQRAIKKYKREGFRVTGHKQKGETEYLIMHRPLHWYEKIMLTIMSFLKLS